MRKKQIVIASAAAVAAAGTAAGVGAFLAGRALLRRMQPDFDLHDAVVAITGGSRGLGFALAMEFASRGAKLAICSRDERTLRDAEHRLQARGARVWAYSCDVGVRQQAESFIRGVEEQFGHIDVLINNAGQIEVGPLDSQRIEDFENAMNTMYWGMVYTIMTAYPGMAKQGLGHIVNITSIGGKMAVPHLLPYSAAKFAAMGFSEGLHAELARKKLKVTTVVPGLMRTGSHMNAIFKGDHRKEYSWFALAASLPLLSMDARRAARKIVDATARGASEIILTPQAKLAAVLHGVAPGLVSDLLGVSNRFLPGTGSHLPQRYTGKESESLVTRSFLTRAGRKAAHEYNQHPNSGPVGCNTDVSSTPLTRRNVGENPTSLASD